ncbi:uncharacterized protein RAG0_04548 [Rhynchosporium agropyri]|uniref:Uncharacterized protein n=1 Tax=Rhynchosporium agropyri TaxID=914238 RepID=A0A1E1K931_9HELO|nr:uncharacterized protein RAG0_04548 [Rhynchosporium agropyri]
MCVKEFLGYNCGHCAMPYLRQCPLTSSNPTFPPCKFPAERPIFTNENCHPCSRVLWNAKVLADEEKHRKQHSMGDCDCPVIFDAADRERRLRSRNGRGKGKGKELTQGEQSEPGKTQAGPRHYDNESADARGSQQGWCSQSGNNAHYYEYTGYRCRAPAPVSAPVHPNIDHLGRGFGIPQDGFVPHQYISPNTLMMNQPGSGMKWYPEHQNQIPVQLPFTSSPASYTVPTIMAALAPVIPNETFALSELTLFAGTQDPYPRFQKKKAASEPAEFRYSPYPSSSEFDLVLDEDVDVGFIKNSPVVVSSSVVENTIPM